MASKPHILKLANEISKGNKILATSVYNESIINLNEKDEVNILYFNIYKFLFNILYFI